MPLTFQSPTILPSGSGAFKKKKQSVDRMMNPRVWKPSLGEDCQPNRPNITNEEKIIDPLAVLRPGNNQMLSSSSPPGARAAPTVFI